MRETSPTGNKQQETRHRGFTMIELLVVLVILGLSMAVVAPRVANSLDASRFNASLRAVLATARAARTEARTEQREVSLVFDVVDRTYRVDEKRQRTIQPRHTKLKVTAAESEQLSDSRIAIRFFPDGSATGGRVHFTLNKHSRFVDVDWLTGLTTLEP